MVAAPPMPMRRVLGRRGGGRLLGRVDCAAAAAERHDGVRDAGKAVPSPRGGGGRASKGQLFYDKAHEKDASAAGMWDGLSVTGPSCICVPGGAAQADVTTLERLYLQARQAYFSGAPLVADEMYDVVEERLRAHGVASAHKWPRCSVTKRKVYADAVYDAEQMRALATTYGMFLLLGGTLVAAGAAGCVSAPLAALRGEAAAVPVEPALAAMALLLGGALLSTAWRSLSSLRDGALVALRGGCPACGSEVYAFASVPPRRSASSPAPQIRHACECHVCDRPLVVEAAVAPAVAPAPWAPVMAQGRVYLVSRETDFFPPAASELWTR